MDYAVDLTQSMTSRAQELDTTSGFSSPRKNFQVALNDGLSYAASGSLSYPLGRIGAMEMGGLPGHRTVPSGRSQDDADQGDGGTLTPPKRRFSDSEDKANSVQGGLGLVGSASMNDLAQVEPMECPSCGEDSVLKRDQLVPCTACCQRFHTTCFGARRIPFSLKTLKERQNREKYVSKHFGSWRCDTCVASNAPSVSTSSPTTVARILANSTPSLMASGGGGGGGDQQWTPSYRPNGGVAFQQNNDANFLGSPMSKTKHEQAAMLMGLLASSGLTIESLMTMGEDKQREALIAAASMQSPRQPSTTGFAGGVAGAMPSKFLVTGEVNTGVFANGSGSGVDFGDGQGTGVGVGVGVGNGHGISSVGTLNTPVVLNADQPILSSNQSKATIEGRKDTPVVDAKNVSSKDDPRQAMLAMLAKRGANIDEQDNSATQIGPKLKDDLKLSKFIKMIKVRF